MTIYVKQLFVSFLEKQTIYDQYIVSYSKIAFICRTIDSISFSYHKTSYNYWIIRHSLLHTLKLS